MFQKKMSNPKCLNLSFGLVISFYVLTYVRCTPDFGIDKNSQELADSDVQKLSDQSETDLKETEDKRQWANFASWGKRDWNSNFAPWGKRDWNSNFAPWGKRWNSFSTWGKRSGDEFEVQEPVDKRSWFKLASWGKRSADDKRKWNQFSAWGKRDDSGLENDKRKWQQFSAWGKRDNDFGEVDKRKWNQFSAWGKRDLEDQEGAGVDKRKWSQFAPWGKRTSDDDYEAEKRKWSGLSTWGKRKWSGLSTWGKRAANVDESVLDDMSAKLIQYFDSNGDGVLDNEEIMKYISAIMSMMKDQEIPQVVVQAEES